MNVDAVLSRTYNPVVRGLLRMAARQDYAMLHGRFPTDPELDVFIRDRAIRHAWRQQEDTELAEYLGTYGDPGLLALLRGHECYEDVCCLETVVHQRLLEGLGLA